MHIELERTQLVKIFVLWPSVACLWTTVTFFKDPLVGILCCARWRVNIVYGVYIYAAGRVTAIHCTTAAWHQYHLSAVRNRLSVIIIVIIHHRIITWFILYSVTFAKQVMLFAPLCCFVCTLLERVCFRGCKPRVFFPFSLIRWHGITEQSSFPF